MPKIRCASIDCKWNSDTNMCMYKGTLFLNDGYYHTYNEGFAHFHRCKMFEQTESAKILTDNFIRFLKERGLNE